MTREELIEALEGADGPSKSLDSAIHAEMRREGWTPKEWARTVAELDNPSIVNVPRYTSSLDAALSLVPEGWGWSLDWTQRPLYQDCGRADLYAPGSGIKPHDVSDVYGATPAIALCLAALKART
jgi:hypothetical protein